MTEDNKPKTFEVAIYNKVVMEKLHRGERHPQLKDDWAEVHYFKVTAYSADQARRKLEQKYPADRGFVIDGVIQISED